MLVIRLSRRGAKKRPFYHINLADQRRANAGRFIEKLGFFDPLAKDDETRLKLDVDRFDYWLNKGAKPTETLKNLVMAKVREITVVKKVVATGEEGAAETSYGVITLLGSDKLARRAKGNKATQDGEDAASPPPGDAASPVENDEATAATPAVDAPAEETMAAEPAVEPAAVEEAATEPAVETAAVEEAAAEPAVEPAAVEEAAAEPAVETAATGEAAADEPAAAETKDKKA